MATNTITAKLLRMACHEVMDELHMSLDDLSQAVGYHLMTMRVWLNRPTTNVPQIERKVDRFLESLPPFWSPAPVAVEPKRTRRPRRDPSLPRRCYRCGQSETDVEFYGNGYCKPCGRAYQNERNQSRKRVAV